MKKEGYGHNGPREVPEGGWEYQIRINLSEEFAAAARDNPMDPLLEPLMDILDKYDATLKNQYEAFAGFLPQYKKHEEHDLQNNVREAQQAIQDAEAANDTDAAIEALKQFEEASEKLAARYRLYLWTKKNIVENPGKREHYENRFTIYADGGKEVYSKAVADALVAELEPLVKSGMIKKIDKFDSNPANNPQAPAKFHR